MVARFLWVVFPLLLIAQTNPSAAGKPEEVVKRSLQAYCDKNGVNQNQLKPARLTLLPGMVAFRYPLPAVVGGKDNHALPERNAVVFVDATYGGIIEFKLLVDQDSKKTRRNILAAMALGRRTVRSGGEAREVIANLFALDGWLTGYDLSDYKPPTADELREGAGPYRDRPRTYGNGGRGYLKLVGADDFGIEVDADGYVVAFLCGHIR